MKVLVTGATGLIGSALCRSLVNEGQAIVTLSRHPHRGHHHPAAEVHQWEPEVSPPPAQALQGVDAVVHLAGEPVAARRWTAEQKQRIRDSRVIGTRHLVTALGAAEARPGVLISASAVGIYGDRGDEALDEQSSAGRDFLSAVCQEWEQEAARARALGLRVAPVRIGVVLSTEGGALPRMLPPFKLGVGGRLGSGRQWFPWVHIADVVGIIRHALLSPALGGPVNAVAPGIVTNAEFTQELARVLHRPAGLPVPEFALRLLMGETAEVLLASQRVTPRVALAAGYQFRYPTLQAALDQLLGSSGAAAGASGPSRIKNAREGR
jgi:hypothetical protein